MVSQSKNCGSSLGKNKRGGISPKEQGGRYFHPKLGNGPPGFSTTAALHLYVVLHELISAIKTFISIPTSRGNTELSHWSHRERERDTRRCKFLWEEVIEKLEARLCVEILWGDYSCFWSTGDAKSRCRVSAVKHQSRWRRSREKRERRILNWLAFIF